MSNLYTRPLAGMARILLSFAIVAGLAAVPGSATAQTAIGASPYTVPASGSYTVPAGIHTITVQCWGGGGGGGGGNAIQNASGGGGGGYASSALTVTPLVSYTVVVGTGGAGGYGGVSNANGNAGSASIFGSNQIVANSGQGGLSGGGSAQGGSSNTGTTTYNGGSSSGTGYIGGGSSAGTNSNGNHGHSGAAGGGAAVTGGGAGGNPSPGSFSSGSNGGTPGGGGGAGAYNYSGGTSNYRGGAGGAGQVIISYTLPQGSLTGNGPFSGSGTGQLTYTDTALATGPYTIVYSDGTNSYTATSIPNGTAFTVTPGTVSTTTSYTLVSVTDVNSNTRTTGFTGPSATITVNPIAIGASPYTVPASGSYTVPAGIHTITVQCWGGGGGSGGTTNTAQPNPTNGGGGGGGAFASSTLAVTPLQAYTIAVGAAGAAGSPGLAGGNGGSSSFGANQVVASGGKAGTGGQNITSGLGGAGGAASGSTGTIIYSGGNASMYGGGGGGSAGINSNGNNGSNHIGGAAVAGGGAGSTTIFSGNGRVGLPGGVPGGGASGAYSGAYVNSSEAGGAGGAGQVIISYTLPQGSLTANGPFIGSGTGQLTYTDTALATGPYTIVYYDGTGNITVTRANGVAFTVNPNPLISTTTYTLVSVTDANGNIRTTGFTGPSATIVVNPASQIPQGSLSTPTPTVCNSGGSAIGQLEFTATAGASPYTIWYHDNTNAMYSHYNLSSGSAFSVFSLASTTTYTLDSVQDANGNIRRSGFTGSTATITVSSCGYTWLGGSTDWQTASNWSSNSVPNSSSADVVIPAGRSHYPVLANLESVHSLTMGSGATITLQGYTIYVYGDIQGPTTGRGYVTGIPSNNPPDGYLVLQGNGQSILGNLSIDVLGVLTGSAAVNSGNIFINKFMLMYQGDFTNNGTLTLASNSSGDAYFDDFTSGGAGTYSGDMTVQRYFSNSNIGYRDIGSPVSTTVSDLANSFPVFGQDGVDCYYSYSPYPNVQYYDEGLVIPVAAGNFLQGWVSYTGLSNPLSPMKGIAARTYSTSPFTITFTGAPYSGAQSTGITHHTNGWNLVSNPYPSPISWSAVKSHTGGATTGTYYVYHTTGEYTGSWGSNNGTAGVNSAPDHIGIGQGFFVQTSSGSASFSIDNSVRTGNPGGYFGISPVLDNEVRLVLGNGTNSDEVVTYTDASATDGYDLGQDAVKMPAGSTVSLAYSLGSKDYAINVMNSIDVQTVLPLTISVADTGSYALNATTLNVTGLTPYLRDAQANTLTDLTAGPVQLTLNGGQVYAGRYSVVFQANTTGIGTTSEATTTQIYAWHDRVYVKRSSNNAATISVTNLLGQNIAGLHSNSANTDFELPAVQPWYAIVKVTEGEKVTVSKVLISNK